MVAGDIPGEPEQTKVSGGGLSLKLQQAGQKTQKL